jgi:hypothetical protein
MGGWRDELVLALAQIRESTKLLDRRMCGYWGQGYLHRLLSYEVALEAAFDDPNARQFRRSA